MQVIWIFVVAVLSTVEAQIIFPNDETEVQYENVFGRCITPNGDRSVCVYLQECGDLYSLITKVPLSNDDKLYLRKSQCGYYNGKVLVCCPSGSKPITTPVTIQPNQGISNQGNVNQGNPNQGNPNQGNPNQGYPNQGGTNPNNNGGGGGGTLPQPGVCGSGNSDRIYGGNRTKIDEYPWMVLLEYSKPGGRSGHHCGGVLINERYVLTASHCVNGKAIPTDWRLSAVRLGEWDTATEEDCEGDDCSDPVQNIPIERSIPHEQYNPNSRSQYNDIALLRLSRSIKFTDWIKPICLPSAAYLRSATFEGISLDVAGWGKTETVSASNIKLKAAVDGVSLQQCNQVYNLQNIVLQDTQVCAGGEKGVDSCRGDSGGPLIGFDTSNKVRPYSFLVGIVSFGPSPCGLEGWPGVYTRVGAYLDWIQSHISA